MQVVPMPTESFYMTVGQFLAYLGIVLGLTVAAFLLMVLISWLFER